MTSKWMENRMPRQIKPTDTEKITINIGYVDLGRIDLLVEEGLYTNRTDFIRASIRAQIATHALEMGRLVLTAINARSEQAAYAAFRDGYLHRLVRFRARKRAAEEEYRRTRMS
jgi:Arc/MetJ-type ribon-helix-helix transcriptional regulator